MYVTSDIIRNTKFVDKPNEDFIICDSKNNIFILLDGVSRDRENGKYPNPSPAKEVSELLGTQIHLGIYSALSDSMDILKIIKDSILESNRLVANYNIKNELSFFAGAVGIIAVLKDYKFYFCYIGDCSGRLIRESKIILFTEIQTDEINKHKKEYSSYEIRHVICNNPSHPYSYGVLNGNSHAEFFLRSGVLQVYPQDHIILSSDGLEPFLSKLNSKKLQANCAEQLLQMAIIENNINQDDRSIIKIII